MKWLKIETRPFRIKPKTSRRKRRNHTRVSQKYAVLQTLGYEIGIMKYGEIRELVERDHFLTII